MARVRVVVEKKVCDRCLLDDIEPPGEVAQTYYDTPIQLELCTQHDRDWMPWYLILFGGAGATAENTAEAAVEVHVGAPRRDAAATPAAIEAPKPVPEPRREEPPVKAEPVRPAAVEEPVPATEQQEALLPPVAKTPRYGDVVCVACREAGLPADEYTIPYKHRREHALREPHKAAMTEIVWEGPELRFPCTNSAHEACQRTGFAFPSEALADAHSNDKRAKSLRAARATQQGTLQQKLRESGVPLVVCPLEHDFEGPFAVDLTKRSAHAGSHGLHAGEISWKEDGTPLPYVCSSTTKHHRKCTGRLGFPSQHDLNNHHGFTGAAREKMIQAGLLPVG